MCPSEERVREREKNAHFYAAAMHSRLALDLCSIRFAKKIKTSIKKKRPCLYSCISRSRFMFFNIKYFFLLALILLYNQQQVKGNEK